MRSSDWSSDVCSSDLPPEHGLPHRRRGPVSTMVATDIDVLASLDALQNRYIAALDGKDIAGWADCFSQREDATYICRSAENEANGWPIALMLDDCRARIADRIT